MSFLAFRRPRQIMNRKAKRQPTTNPGMSPMSMAGQGYCELGEGIGELVADAGFGVADVDADAVGLFIEVEVWGGAEDSDNIVVGNAPLDVVVGAAPGFPLLVATCFEASSLHPPPLHR